MPERLIERGHRRILKRFPRIGDVFVSTLRELEYEQVSPRLLEVLRREGYATLTDFQRSTLDAGIIRGNSLLLVTYDYDEGYQIAEIAVLNHLASDFRARAIIACPNPHTVEKRLRSLRPKCRRLGIEATALTRRGVVSGAVRDTGRLLIATFSSLSMALRSRSDLLEDVGCAFVERLDLIGDTKMGPRIESVLVSMLSSGRDIQYIAMLPPVADLEELGRWLRARPVHDPKPEVRRIFSVKAFSSLNESLVDLTEFVHFRRGQVIILCPNISACENLALQLSGVSDSEGPVLDLRLPPEERDLLRQIAENVSEVFEYCHLTKRLASTIRKGVAFLHEGVARPQRRTVSEAWEEGHIPVLVMPTRFALASGLRATVVFLLSVYMHPLDRDIRGTGEPTMLTEWQFSEVLYSAGRAGLDNEAFGIVTVDSELERLRVIGRYFDTRENGDIVPRLGEVDSLMDDPDNAEDLVLSQICSGTGKDVDSPLQILGRTYWAASNRITDIHQDTGIETDIEAQRLIAMHSQKAVIKRAQSIPDTEVRLVSVTPTKIEGLVHSSTRKIWHYVKLRADEGVSCSCESWKYQGRARHRLCKHLVKFASFALDNDETRPYAASVIQQALRGLNILEELERDRLIVRGRGSSRCTDLGRNVVMLGVPVADAKRVIRTISKRGARLRPVLVDIAVARTGLREDLVEKILRSLPDGRIEEVVHEDDMPGIVENAIEEVYYTVAILLRVMGASVSRSLKMEALKLKNELEDLLEDLGRGRL